MDTRWAARGLFLGMCFLSMGAFWDKAAQTAPIQDQQAANQTVSVPAFSDMMNQLSQNLQGWSALPPDSKKRAVEAVISLYKNRDNTAILNGADFYVQKLDEALAANAPFMNADILTVVKILAVMEYDFYNGQNKDELAKELLGEGMAQAIRAQRQLTGQG